MRIIEPNAGDLTNFEVLDFLRSRGAGKDRARLLASMATSEYKVYDYLEQTAACNQTRVIVSECREKCKAYDLTKSEILNIINIRPSIPAEMDPIIEQCEARIGLEKMDELVECVAQLLPLAPKPEENESGEAIDKACDENLAGNEKESDEATDKASDENLAGNEKNIVT